MSVVIVHSCCSVLLNKLSSCDVIDPTFFFLSVFCAAQNPFYMKETRFFTVCSDILLALVWHGYSLCILSFSLLLLSEKYFESCLVLLTLEEHI